MVKHADTSQSYPIQSYDIDPESDSDYDYGKLYYGKMITKRWGRSEIIAHEIVLHSEFSL
jgi:hypothetical protein